MDNENIEEIFLKRLYKYQLYDKLNKNSDKVSNCEHCRLVKGYLSQYEGLNELCCTFAKNALTLSKILEDEKDYDEHCRYFTFWIHEEIRKILKNYVGTYNSEHILRKFFTVASKLKTELLKNKCEYAHKGDITLDLWKEWKDLYDFIINYNDIKSLVTSDEYLCQIYPTYLDYIENVYRKYKSECCERYSEKCPLNFKINHWCNNSEFLSKLTCTKSRTFNGASILSDGTLSLSQVQVGKGSSETELSLEHANSIVDNVSFNNSDYYVKLSVIFLLFGIILAIFLLYNFTTLGTWIQSKVIKKKEICCNLDEDAEDLLLPYSDNIDIKCFNDNVNINYHPT
ncbi:PIR Superfamily Protein [Plasmodium ovale wallikeri]|uniref:PIR Superfamily Protein n=3 Tax=Plasmodium ovale TaxID=36330 RepID=A0A1A9AHY1_PLAOA|nr:PIR Superfamily Protein [Plasmodium ovale wallikeri]SBT57379.1 PIR Superfamily Protein [Plasmodium ovale wallikeri]SBT73450.1 Plasmodium vivax Vir protein, putative [Plasmodium ovale]